MKLEIQYTKQFKKDLKKAKKQGKDLDILKKVMQLIVEEKPLPSKLKDHLLLGNWRHYRELHLESDWLLIYRVILEDRAALFARLGSHSELFY